MVSHVEHAVTIPTVLAATKQSVLYASEAKTSCAATNKAVSDQGNRY